MKQFSWQRKIFTAPVVYTTSLFKLLFLTSNVATKWSLWLGPINDEFGTERDSGRSGLVSGQYWRELGEPIRSCGDPVSNPEFGSRIWDRSRNRFDPAARFHSRSPSHPTFPWWGPFGTQLILRPICYGPTPS